MKFLKWLGITVLSLFLLVTIIGLFQPGDMRVERKKVISAPPAEVFAVVNNAREFQKWSPWHKKDTSTQYVYSGPEAGKGATFTWKSNNSAVGYGKWEVLDAVPNSRVDLQFTYEDYPPTPAGYILKPAGTGTELTWYMDAEDVSNPWEKFGGIMMEYFVGKDYNEGLESLEAYMKTKPKVVTASAAPAGRVDRMGLEEFKGGHALSIRGTINAADLSATLGQRYAQMLEYIKSKGLTMMGHPFAVYHTWDGKTTDLEACLWIDKADKGAGSIKGMQVPSGRVVVADYYGPYAGSEAAHYALDEWAKKNNTKLAMAPWEEYITDPTVEKDPMKVLTRIYYRVL